MTEPQPWAGAFPLTDVREFLQVFLDGLLTEGITQPLKKFSEGRHDSVAEGARDWREKLMSGAGPVPALQESIGFPQPVNELLIEGMEVGALDYVVRDLIALLEDSTPGNAADRLSKLLAEYQSRPKRTTLCVGCVQRDIERMFRRAEVEGAVEVRLAYGYGFMEQRFAGPYIVEFRQPTRDEVHAAMLELLKQGGEIATDIRCRNGSQPNQYILERQDKTLLVCLES